MSNEPDEVNNGALATIIVIVALATLGIALVVTSLVREETAALSAQKEVSTPQDAAYRQLKAAQLAEITAAPAWRDRKEGLVSIPIERAMELVAESVRENPFNLSPGNPPEEEEALEAEEAADAELAPGEETVQTQNEDASDARPTAAEKAMVQGKNPVSTPPEPMQPKDSPSTIPHPGTELKKSPPAPQKPAPAPQKPEPSP